MPLAVSLFVRALIQIAVTLGLIELAERILLPLLDKALVAVMRAFGVDEEDAKDIVANEVLRAAEIIGVGALILRGKIPLRISEKLGFTTKGWGKRAVRGTTQAKVVATTGKIRTPQGSSIPTLIPALSQAGIKLRPAVIKFLVFFGITTFIADLIFRALFALGQWIDFGNWNSGAYQKRMQGLLEKITFGWLTPDPEYARARVASPEVFDKVWNAYRLEGATAINDPYKAASVPFTRENFIDVVDRLGAHLLTSGKTISAKEVVAGVQLLMVFGPEAREGVTPAAAVTHAAAPSVRAARGTIAVGTLGIATPYIPVAQTTIPNVTELAARAREALINFLRSIPGRIVYDIKLVTSYIDEKGIKQEAVRQIKQVGVDAAGKARMKTLTNRFAIIDVYAAGAGGRRTRIDRLILGPTDAFGITTGITQIAAIEEAVGALPGAAAEIVSGPAPEPAPLPPPEPSPPAPLPPGAPDIEGLIVFSNNYWAYPITEKIVTATETDPFVYAEPLKSTRAFRTVIFRDINRLRARGWNRGEPINGDDRWWLVEEKYWIPAAETEEKPPAS